MSTPTKRSRKLSTNFAVLLSSDSDLIAKIVSNLEKYLKLRNEEIAALSAKVAEFKRVLQLDVNYNILVHRCPVAAFIEDVTVRYFLDKK